MAGVQEGLQQSIVGPPRPAILQSCHSALLMFSRRVPADLAPNRLHDALARRRADGRVFADLTESNPTRAGFDYPADLLTPLGEARGLAYQPEPLGMGVARLAIAADFERRNLRVDPAQIALTASTSEAYSILFKVLCDPGDEVLVPRPSYPLYEHLLRLDAVTAVPYDLEYHGSWSIDLATVEHRLSARTRAILVVNPNNPTGNFVGPDEIDRLATLGARGDAAVISDEVFADYPLAGCVESAGHLFDRSDVLGFTLGGLSKSIGLPQAKLGWIAVSGARPAVNGALARLELACDTYLSVSTPVQLAAAALLERGGSVRRQIQRRLTANYAWLNARVTETPACTVLRADAGWYAVVQVPSLTSEEDLVLKLLQEDDVLVHPGYFFDFAMESFLIVSLLVRPDMFREGISRICRHFECGSTTP
jgi:aspartate/methionine/tyrosine aminotransferase